MTDQESSNREVRSQRAQQLAHLLPEEDTRVPGGKAWPLRASSPSRLNFSAKPSTAPLILLALDLLLSCRNLSLCGPVVSVP